MTKTKGKFTSWAVRSLSFAGRLQLLASVITGCVVFWITTFKLPSGCIKEIESLCSRFLWSGGIENHHKAKVAWSTVCLPKAEGGLGLRRFTQWNTTLSLKLVWRLFSNGGSLWVDWHRFHNLKVSLSDNISTFWTIKEKANDSWNWKCLLRLRPLAERFLRCYIGNGLTASFWRDNWTPFGPLLKHLGDAGPTRLRIPLHATMADAANGNSWDLPMTRSPQVQSLQSHLDTISLPLRPLVGDDYGWYVNNVDCNGFSSSKTWQALRQREEKKAWAAAIWFKGSIPRNAFNMWTTHLDRLPTRSRLHSWGMPVSPFCCLCSTEPETRDHLMFHCAFTTGIWSLVQSRLNLHSLCFLDWAELLSWVRRTSPTAPSTLRKLVTQAVIYATWKQRNNMLHNSQHIAPASVFKIIDREIINSINARRHRRKFRKLMSCWLV